MRYKKISRKLLTSIVCLPLFFTLKAQETEAPKKSPFNISIDLVSSYVWRGVPCSVTSSDGKSSVLSLAPHIQPQLTFTNGHFEIGAWGSTDFRGEYKEVDLYLSYLVAPFTFTITDYDWNFKNRYFNYKSKETDHIFEGTVGYTGSVSFPLNVSISVMFAGADKKWNSVSRSSDPGKQAFSTYISFEYAAKHFSPFVALTPGDGYYGDGYGGATGFGIVNVGFLTTKKLKLSENFSLPLKAKLYLNPQKEDIYLVFSITI